VRYNVSTALDAADVWQPHQVLLGSLRSLFGGMMRPRALFRQLALDGPPAAGWLMFVFGTAWLWLLTGGLCALAVDRAAPASPSLALRAGLWWWGCC
jgi:hypothetical protein